MSSYRSTTRGPENPRVEPDTISTYHTHIDGLEVVAREIATGPHPRWGMKHPNTYHFITRLLLEDESELFECNHCHLVDSNLDSIKAHLSAHSTKPTKPLTSEATVRAVLREVARQQRLHGTARYAIPTAAALNKAGVQPAQGAEWTSAAVSSLYRRWRDAYRVSTRETTATKPPAVKPAKVPAQTQRVTDDPLVAAGNLVRQAAVLLRQAELRIQEVASRPVEQVIDQELADKARKYDEMVKRLLG